MLLHFLRILYRNNNWKSINYHLEGVFWILPQHVWAKTVGGTVAHMQVPPAMSQYASACLLTPQPSLVLSGEGFQERFTYICLNMGRTFCRIREPSLSHRVTFVCLGIYLYSATKVELLGKAT